MAGVQRQKDSKGKWRYRIQFYDTAGKRHSVWLGRVSSNHANDVASHIENLVDAAKHGSTVPAKTLAWLQDEATDKVIERLSNAGLCGSRERCTLGEFIQAYIESREDASENTVRNFSNSRQKLVDYFAAEKPLHDITTGEADDWRQWLVNQKYSDATISKAVKHAKHFLLMAKRKGLVRLNPFHHLRAGGEENESRKRFIEQHIIDRAIEMAPDTQWKLIIALARYGGLRCPSEVLALSWADVDWENRRITVTSPKTKKQGKAYRVVPLFPELRPLLERAFEEAEDGALYVITKYRQRNANLRTQFERILKRAGIESWERLFQNLRASRETELANEYPLHVVTAWLGNTERVASKHYLQVTDSHFEQAQRAKTGATTCHSVSKPAPQESAASGTDSQETKEPSEVTSQVTFIPTVSESGEVPPRGVEPLLPD
jgi:integrase